MTIPHFSGKFSAHSSATKYANPQTFNEVIEATQQPEPAGQIAALQSDTKLKKASKKPDKNDEYIKVYLPPVKKQGVGNYKPLKFKLDHKGDVAADVFVASSLATAKQIEDALKADNLVEQPERGIVHSKYVSARFLKHANGGLERYIAAKKAFAENADLPRLPDRIKIKLLVDGSLRIEVEGKHFLSRKLLSEKTPFPKGENPDVAAFVNSGIRRAKNLAAGYHIPLKQVEASANTGQDQDLATI